MDKNDNAKSLLHFLVVTFDPLSEIFRIFFTYAWVIERNFQPNFATRSDVSRI